MSIRHVLFDLGNVLLPFDPQRIIRSLAKHCSIPEKKILEDLWENPVCSDFEKGLLSSESFFENVSKNWDMKIDFETFTKIFNDIFREDIHVTSLLPEIKKQGFSLGLISNINPIHWEYIQKTYNFIDQLDVLSLSHEVGSRKPDMMIFQHAFDLADCPPQNIFYIDDIQQFILAAKEWDVQAVLYKNPELLRQELISRKVLAP